MNLDIRLAKKEDFKELSILKIEIWKTTDEKIINYNFIRMKKSLKI